MIYNAANMLTLSRLVMAVIFFVLIAFKSWWAVPMLVLAGVTDLLDVEPADRFRPHRRPRHR